MKAVAAVITALALQGCAVHNNEWIVPAAVGAVVGITIHQAVRPPMAHPPVMSLPPRPILCHYRPWYDQWGYYRGDQRICY